MAEQPDSCSFCGTEDVPLTDYTQNYGPEDVRRPYWLCRFCESTMAAATEHYNRDTADPVVAKVVADVARMLHVLARSPVAREDGPDHG